MTVDGPTWVSRLAFAGLAAIAFAFMAGAEAAAAEDPSPCGLLTAGESEVVFGEPLATAPFRASNGAPDAEGQACRFETADFRAIELSVEWHDGATAFGLMNAASGLAEEAGVKGTLVLSDGTTLRGEWDEARVFLCCAFYALRGDRMVVIDIAGSRATIPQAAELANAAIKRLDQPLAGDDGAAVVAARERAKARPAIVSVCGLLPRARAEEITGAPLKGEPQGDEASCSYDWTQPATGLDMRLTLNVTWRGGFAEMRSVLAAIGQVMPSLGLPAEAEHLAGAAFDEHAISLVGVMAVRKDVLLSIETGGMGNDIATAFIAAAAEGL